MRGLFLVLLAVLAGFGFAQTAKAPDLKSLERAYTSAKAALARTPKDPKVRAKFVTAGVKYGHESMVSPALSPRVKYRQALHIYREVLKVDPKNPVALQEKNLIESIYRQMGRPIPD